jgi:hypothetical protein
MKDKSENKGLTAQHWESIFPVIFLFISIIDDINQSKQNVRD